MPTIDYFSVAATIAGAMIARKTADVEVKPSDAAKLFWEVRQALIDAAPKGNASAGPLRT